MGIKVRGHEDLQRRMDAAVERVRSATDAGLYLVANNVVGDAQVNAPLDKGPLRGSAYTTHPLRSGTTSTCEIGFGGPAAEYAAVQHEELGFSHDVGEAKFLENAVNRAASTFAQDVAAVARDHFNSNAGGLPTGMFPTSPGGGK